jgi:cellulose synthase operon protein C
MYRLSTGGPSSARPASRACALPMPPVPPRTPEAELPSCFHPLSTGGPSSARPASRACALPMPPVPPRTPEAELPSCFHPLSTGGPSRAAWRAWSGLLVAAIVVAAGCAHAPPEVRDTPYVEQLRVRITKVRHAIDETRRTIAASQGAPYLPELYVRLAELLSEEARYHYQVAYEREGRTEEAVHAPQVVFLKEQAIATYRLVLRRYPDTPLAPRILFNISHEQRELGDYDAMLETLRRLVREHATSPLRNEALLVLGDYHFDRSELREAADHYRQILRGGPSSVSGLAFYKLAWVRVNQGNCRGALTEFERAIVASKAWATRDASQAVDADLPSARAIDVQREALIDLAYCYSRERKAEDAVPYLRRHAASRGVYVAALERLGRRYAVMEQALGAAEVGRELLRLAPDGPERLEDARMLHTSLRRLRQWERSGDDVALITAAVLRGVQRPDVTASERERVLQEFEVYVRDLITRAQAALMERRGDKTAMARQVAAAYVYYLDAFPASEHRGEMVHNLAEVYVLSGEHLLAGRRYLEAADLLIAEEETEERRGSLYDAVVHFQRALERSADLRHVDRVVARAGLRRAGSALLAYDLHADRTRQVAFAIAQTLYDEGQHREAIDRLTAVAYAWPHTTESKAAVHLVLDSFRTLNDFEGLMAAGHRFLAAGGPVDAQLRAEIEPIIAAAEQTRLDEISLAAAGDTGEGIEELEAFAERYEGTDLGERALINAFVAARAAGDSERLYQLGDEIAKRYPRSEQLPGILGTLARTAVARYELDRAVTIFRQAAEANPAERVNLLVAVGSLLEQLADVDGARQSYQQALDAASDPASQAMPAARLAALLERTVDARQLVASLTRLPVDQEPEVQARLGLAQLRLGDPHQAEMTLHAVVAGGTASPEAVARAHYGMAEAMFHILDAYEPAGDVESLHELVALVEVTQQSYLNAARYGDPVFTPAAFARLAFLNGKAADRIEKLPLPGGLTQQERGMLERAFAARAQQLRQESTNALAACTEQAWSRQLFNAAARACLSGSPPDADPVAFDSPTPRRRTGDVEGLEELRGRLARNPEDLDSLRELGLRFLDAGDPHVARLVFARTARAGGGPIETNLLGVASYLAGDRTAALEAFAAAADGGLVAGRENLVRVLMEMGLNAAADTARERYSGTLGGGRLLEAGAMRGGAS